MSKKKSTKQMKQQRAACQNEDGSDLCLGVMRCKEEVLTKCACCVAMRGRGLYRKAFWWWICMGGEKGSECMGGGGQYPFYCGRVIVCVRRGRLTDWGGGGREGEREEGRVTGLGLFGCAACGQERCAAATGTLLLCPSPPGLEGRRQWALSQRTHHYFGHWRCWSYSGRGTRTQWHCFGAG